MTVAGTYIEATEAVRRRLRTPAFPVGGALSISQIPALTGVSHNTAATVLRQLAAQGEVEIRLGDPRGSIVLDLPEGTDEVGRLLSELGETATRASRAIADASEALQSMIRAQRQLARVTQRQRETVEAFPSE